LIQNSEHLRFIVALISLGDCPNSSYYSDSAAAPGANHMTKTRLKLASPATVNRTVTPVRRPNAELRPREHLTEREVDKLIDATRGNRWGQRDSAMLLLCFRHGLRASELCGLHWSDVEFETGTLHLRRAKGGATSTHPLLGDELRALRALKREAQSPFIFVSERGAPFSTSGFAKLVERAGIEAKLPFKVHPHMLRHSTGYALANKSTDTRTLQAYLGHRSIQSTVRYTELAPGRFKNLWR
jgi:type 1 fimbriae regulatory protein FimB/type 1 fimbriae regulatory protein FimE